MFGTLTLYSPHAEAAPYVWTWGILQLALDYLCVNLGKEIAKRVPGFVSTEVRHPVV